MTLHISMHGELGHVQRFRLDDGVVGTNEVGHAYVWVVDDCAEVFDLWIDHQHRNKGYAQLLLRNIAAFAKSIGVRTLQAHVSPDNKASVKVFEALDFEAKGVELHMEVRVG